MIGPGLRAVCGRAALGQWIRAGRWLWRAGIRRISGRRCALGGRSAGPVGARAPLRELAFVAAGRLQGHKRGAG